MVEHNINIPRTGMNRDVHPMNLTETQYTIAFNTNYENELGDGFPMLQNEPSNILCSTFKEGFKLIGYKSDINDNKLYVFLTNPDTGESEIGCLNINYNVTSIEEEEVSCGCNIKILLDEPLECKEQTPYCTYETKIEDSCNLCLNFSICHPIHPSNIQLKDEKCGKTLYWTDGENPPRYLNLTHLDQYFYIGEEVCNEENQPTCVDCEKLRIFKKFKKPCLEPVTIEYGGNLRKGTYEFLIAYSDANGNELSEYYSIVQPVSIFDRNNVTLDQTELNCVTNNGIRLQITDLDPRYNYYKIAVIQRTDVNNATSYFIEGVHTVNDRTITYFTDEGLVRTTLANLLAVRPIYTKADIMTSSNNYLFMAGLEAEKEMNLQPVVNLMGGFLRWNTHVAKEALYEDGVNTSLYKGYMRDEVYPFSIRFFTDCGFTTAKFPLINRPPTPYELEVVDNKDIESINCFAESCSDTGRVHRWQYYNTAEVIDRCPIERENLFFEVTRDVEKKCKIEDVDQLLNFEFTLPEDAEYFSFDQYVGQYESEICDSNSPYFNLDLCALISDSKPNLNCTPYLEQNCTNPTLLNESILVDNVLNEILTNVEKPLEDYEFGNYSGSDVIYIPGEDNGFDLDEDFIDDFMNQTEEVFIRFDNSNNNSCNGAFPLQSGFPNLQSYIHQYDGSNTQSDLQLTNFNSSCTDADFTSNVHSNAKWFKFSFGTLDKIILEVSPTEECEVTDDISTGETLRVNTYDSCSGGNSIQCEIYNIEDGLFMELDASLYPSGEVCIAIDTPMEQKTITNSDGQMVSVFVLTPPCRAINVNVRDIEFERRDIFIEEVTFCKEQVYNVECVFQIPNLGSCDTIPYEYGKFSYYESELKYPCNDELYDSTSLNIRPTDIPLEIRQEFEDYYTDGVNNGNYIFNDGVNFSDTNLRFYQFPDNCISPFMNEEDYLPFQESVIYPIGVSIDNDIINAFLDIAVLNDLIDLETRESITNYEIFRGDRTLDRGIIAKGLLYDIYKYEEQGDEWYYPNYPYNDLGDDVYRYLDQGRQDLIPHPYNSTQNTRFTFHSPDTHFRKPSLPNEVKIEGYQFGHSRGRFVDVHGHSKWVILGDEAYRIALALAIAEALFEMSIIVAEAWIQASQNYWIQAGFVVGSNPVGSGIGTAFAIATSVAAAIAQATFKVGQYRYEWLRILRDNGKTSNFAYYYTSEGFYNKFLCHDFNLNGEPDSESNQLRGTAAIRYIKSGNYKINDLKTGDTITLNNFQRESSVYISFSEDCPFDYDPIYAGYDNNVINPDQASRFIQSDEECTIGVSPEYTRNIASPYASLRIYKPAQYGTLNSIRWLNTSYCGNLLEDNECDTIFGGDVFISRFSLKRKMPFFYTNAVGLADLTPFEYYSQRNIGYTRFYCNYSTEERTGLGGALFPDIGDEFVFDCLANANRVYVKPPSKFYLFSYGIPQFLVESDINLNYRYARREYHENFYPNVADYVDWTQEENVSIKEDNTYYYNFAYSKNVSRVSCRMLPENYNQELYDCLFDAPNGVIYSLQDNSEQDITDPWLIYKPLNFYQFPTSAGRLVDLRNIESAQVLGRFENQVMLFNAIDTLRERATPFNEELGNGGIFATRPLEFKRTDLGYAGTQHKAMVSCEFGHFWVDAKRGEVFQVDQNGRNLREITQGLRNWFKEHLPFKILKCQIEGLTEEDLDNSFKGLGITMGWDSRHHRVFLTKLDYRVKPEYKGRITYDGCDFILDDNMVVELTDDNCFEDCSFTVAYSPLRSTQSWISYYSFKPNYYISHNNFFQTGVNYSSDDSELGLWSHLLTNKSYQVFYGKKYGWLIEYPIKERYANSYLRSIEYWLDVRRYHNQYDFAEHRKQGFNKAWIYNNSENTGELTLYPQIKNDLGQMFRQGLNCFDSNNILATQYDKKWTFNHFFNRVKDDCNNVPIWLKDCNDIDKTVNEKSLDFYQCRLDRLRGDWFLVRLLQNERSEFNYIFKWSMNKQTYYS